MVDDTKVGFIWLYGIVVIFAVGIIEMVIFPALETKFIPPMLVAANNTLPPADAAAYAVNVAKTASVLHFVPYVIMFVILVYMIASIYKREEFSY